MKEEVLSFCKDFHEHDRFARTKCALSFALIPRRGAEDLIDFWPMSLVSNLYKPLVKVLTNLLRKLIGKVVSCL